MADLALGISGRIEEGEALQAWVLGPVSGLQWQALVNGAWIDIGAPNSQTYVIPAGSAGTAYRLKGASAEGDVYSTVTGASTVDTKKSAAPVLSGPSQSVVGTEDPGARSIFSWLTFSDADRGNYAGGSLLLQDSTSAAYGGDGHDMLSIRFDGTQAGQFSYNAATREVKYAFSSTNVVAIGTLDAALNGNGTDLKIAFNANATAAVVDALVNNLQFSNSDDSPTFGRLFTLRVTDPSGASAQRVTSVSIENTPDAPVIISPATAAIDENQPAAAVVAAIDPDREAGQPQGISYSLAAGQGDTDNARFEVDAATGALRFKAAPDYEDATHAPLYSVRVRATDSQGSTTEQGITVTVRDVNEAPVVHALSADAQEDGAPVAFGASFSDPDANDSHTIVLDTTGTVGTVTLQGTTFTYDPGTHFQSLGQGETATDTFTYTVTDAGGLSSTRAATVTILGSNDTALIGGTTSADVYEDTNLVDGFLVASGVLSISDADAGQARFVAQAATAGDLFQGIFSIDANGAWTYRLDNSSPYAQVLADGATALDSFTVASADGSATQVVSVTVHGASDPAVITGTTELALQEDVAVVNGELKAVGNLTVTDPDFWESQLIAQMGVAGTGGYGTFNVFEQGTWVYRVDNGLAQVQALGDGETLTDTLVVTSKDGSASRTLTVTIAGSNDVPVIDGGPGTAGEVNESGADSNGPIPGVTMASGVLTASDLDGDTLTWSAIASGLYGTTSVDASTGAWSYVLDENSVNGLSAGQSVTDTLAVGVSDGHGGVASQAVSITIHGANDAPTIAPGDVAATVVESSPDGKVLLDPAVAGGIYGITTDAEGHLLIVGQSDEPWGRALWRFNPDGSADTAFGNGGSVFIESSTAFEQVAVDAAGRYVVGGQVNNAENGSADVGLARYLHDGSLDTSFGSGGVLSFDFAAGYDYATQIIATPDGGLLVQAEVQLDPQGYEEMALIRLDASGNLDAAFGNGGKLVYPTPAGTSSDYHAVLDAQGRILIWGTVVPVGAENPGPSVHITRLLADGSVDTSFGNQGSVDQWLDGWYANRGNALAVDANGRIVLGWSAYTSDPGYHVMLTRFDDNGALDATFGSGGTATTGLVTHYGSGFTMGVDAQGRVIVSPHDAGNTWNPQDFTVARFNSDGTPDNSFGTGGVVATDMGGDDHGEHLIVNADGTILVAGNTTTMMTEVVGLARYKADGSLDAGFGTGPADAQAWGWLGGTDPDGTSALTWGGSADGLYGEFTVTGGGWNYRLDNARAATQALEAGQTATDTFTVTLTDEFGAAATQEVVITVIGTYDPPAP